MSRKKIVALLPMKANSERITGKNFKELNGKPLFRWILNTLLSIDEIEQVIINTDARQILEKYGLVETDRVIIRDRTVDLCGDMVSMNNIIADDLDHTDADIYLMTHTTNPFLSVRSIRACIKKFIESKQAGIADSVFTVNKIQTRFYREDATPVNHDPNNLIRTQDLEPWFEENSILYIFSKESFSKTHARIGENPCIYASPKFESIDIDDSDDWEMAIVVGRYLAEQGVL
jgi:CMP-N-acetylneuraminic acid synthetase